jgi:hypothetical protein
MISTNGASQSSRSPRSCRGAAAPPRPKPATSQPLDRPLGAAPSEFRGCGFRFNLTHPNTHHLQSSPFRCATAAPPHPISATAQPRKLRATPSNPPVRSITFGLLGTLIFLLGTLSGSGSIRAQTQSQSQAQAQTQPRSGSTTSTSAQSTTLLVTGAVAQDLHLSLDDLRKMPRKSVSTRDHDGQMHQYDGVPIGAALAKAGVPQGAALRGKSMALTVVAEGTDGYRAVFSVAELDDDFAAESVLIVDSSDGQPLSPDQGPIRLIVPGDKRAARSVRMLKSLTVVNLGGATPSN